MVTWHTSCKNVGRILTTAPCHSQAEKHLFHQLASRLTFANYRMLFSYIQVTQSCFLITVLAGSHSVCLGDSCRESFLIAERILKSVLIKDHSSAQHTLCPQPLSGLLAAVGVQSSSNLEKYTVAKMWRYKKTVNTKQQTNKHKTPTALYTP